MRLTDYRQVRKKVTIGYKCDNCGKIYNGDSMPDDWHEFSAHHNSWGNDSCDSYEYYTACSPKCYVKLFQKSVEKFKEFKDAEVDNFEIDFAKLLSAFLNYL